MPNTQKYTQKDLDHVMEALQLLTEAEEEELYQAIAHGTANHDLASKKALALDSIRAAVLTTTPADAESPMHAAFSCLYDRSRRWLGLSASEVIYRSYFKICLRRPEDRQELAIASRMLGEMQLYCDEPTPETMSEAEEMLAQALALYNSMKMNSPAKKAGRANTLSSLAVLLMMRSQYEEAEKLLREAKAVFRDLSYRGHEEWRPYYAGSLVNMGDLYTQIGETKEAVHCYRQAANVLEKCSLYDPYYIQFAIDHVALKLEELVWEESVDH